MPTKSSIPVNPMTAELGEGIFVGRITTEDFHLYEQFEGFDNIKQSHRDEYHLFFLQEKGTTSIEIDFQKHTIKPLSVIFIHQNQVHRILSFKDATVSVWAISDENLNPEYLNYWKIFRQTFYIKKRKVFCHFRSPVTLYKIIGTKR